MTTALDCRAITKTFHTPQGAITALDGIDLQIQGGEFVSVLGPSGSGKSTLFNIVAGLEQPDAGAVLVGGQNVTGQRGHVAYMPQRDALLPWRSVLDNAVRQPRLRAPMYGRLGKKRNNCCPRLDWQASATRCPNNYRAACANVRRCCVRCCGSVHS